MFLTKQNDKFTTQTTIFVRYNRAFKGDIMALNILKDKEIKEAKPKEKIYFLNDGGGLRLKVDTNGSKIWEFRFTIHSKRKMTTFKTYPTVTLEQARKKRNEYTDFLKHIMIECGTGKDRLPAPLPESEVKIGHKTGTSDKNDRGEYIGINDIGFVILPDGSRYVVAVFVKDSKENMETNAKIISDISAAVYRYAGNR
jgi:hypothetical protein